MARQQTYGRKLGAGLAVKAMLSIGSPPAAIINAIVDALSHLGVTDVGKPATPERVWLAIREARNRGGGA